MLTKLYTAARVATLSVVTLFFSCNKSDNGPVVTPQSQPQNEMQASVAIPQPKTQVEPIKDYNGVAWGIDFAKFKEQKHYKYDLTNTNSLDQEIAMILNTPTVDVFGVPILGVEYIPKKFYAADLEDVHYIFYDGKFAMAFSTMQAKNYDDYYEALSRKYEKITTVHSAAASPNNLYRSGKPSELDAILFRSGDVRVYLIRMKEYSVDVMATGVSVLYIPDKYYNLISNEIALNEKNSPEKQKEKDLLKRDLDKLK